MTQLTLCDRCLEAREPKVRIQVSTLPITRGIPDHPTTAEICGQCAEAMKQAWHGEETGADRRAAKVFGV